MYSFSIVPDFTDASLAPLVCERHGEDLIRLSSIGDDCCDSGARKLHKQRPQPEALCHQDCGWKPQPRNAVHKPEALESYATWSSTWSSTKLLAATT